MAKRKKRIQKIMSISIQLILLVAGLCLLAVIVRTAPTHTANKPLPSITAACAANNDSRAKAIKEAFQHAYNGYRLHAWGSDELLPKTNGSSNSRNGWGASIVDGLDTMLIMGLEDEYNEALEYIAKIDFTQSDTPVKGFETGIRYLGGLLAANDLAPNPLLVQKAVELTDNVLLPLFDQSPSKAPLTYMDLKTKEAVMADTINLAEFGTYSLEFTRLSQILGDPKYAAYANSVVDRALMEPTAIPGLFPTTWDAHTFQPVNSSITTIGGGADSFYEYLIKNYLLQLDTSTDERDRLLHAWTTAVESIEKHLAAPSQGPVSRMFVASATNDNVNRLQYTSQELICFWPGNIALGASQVPDDRSRQRYWQFANDFMDACQAVWEKTATGIAPESWSWSVRGEPATRKRQQSMIRSFTIDNGLYDLRPETIESIFYFYRLTGDTKYQDIAWSMFEAINKYTRTPSGFTRIFNVDTLDPEQDDFQESYFFAETLKYLYLTFVDKECISMNDYVFNTEAHPFKLPRSIQVQH
ncbi:class i alpha-mannosidase [Lichtheimia corymbifera JMRC:FSU:9682]|uniref:alpha-1,2-Mannosidase n=1 Tax=Lichtheimia corymbifera JMRC:FSU:9682 TaxID=1263082 RepID=A0A068RLB3_9FUNG|nr:class i alpha-mannosidase [Lichtheimia corymbifera JMRC:FSU:9682]